MKHLELILAAALCGSFYAAALNAADAKSGTEQKSSVVWLTDFEAAKKQAAAEKKPIMMFFTGSDWCGWCQKLHEDVLDKDEFRKLAGDKLVLLELDFPRSKKLPDAVKKQNDELGKKFKVDGYPTIVVLASDGVTELGRTVGYDSDLVDSLKTAIKKNTSAKKKAASSDSGSATGDGLPAWGTDFEAAKKRAAAEKKPILMYFTGSDWCIWCKRLHADVLDLPEFKKFSDEKLVLLELDFPQEKQLPSELKKQNDKLAAEFDVDGYPCTVVLASDGKTELGRISGYSKEYIAKVQDILDGKGKPVTMDELRKQFDYLPDMLVEYEDLKLTKDELLKEIFEEKPSASDCARITPESVGAMIRENLDQAILLYLAQKAGYKPSPQLVKDSVMKEFDEMPAEERKDLEEALKAQGQSLEDQIAMLADFEEIQKKTAMQLFVNEHAEKAAKKDITEDDVKEFYNSNRAQFPGTFEESKDKALDMLVKARAPQKTSELDKEIEAIRKDVKYWKPEKK